MTPPLVIDTLQTSLISSCVTIKFLLEWFLAMNNFKSKSGSKNMVLVGVLNRHKDFEIAKNLHWYRIPVKKCPKKSVDYIAFYQTSCFGKNGKFIKYYAKVLKINKIKRIKLLPDERKHPRRQKLYYKFSISNLKLLPQIILNRTRRRVSFTYTTLNQLFNSKEISEVFDTPALEEILCLELKRFKIPFKREYCIYKNRKLLYRLDIAIFCSNGKIAIECDNEKWHFLRKQKIKDIKRDKYLKKIGWKVLRFTGSEIINNLAKCIQQIYGLVEKVNHS
ncbi:MAG: DUF559 domain-containing protein [Candidatus Firestonebacteria bacterium]